MLRTCLLFQSLTIFQYLIIYRHDLLFYEILLMTYHCCCLHDFGNNHLCQYMSVKQCQSKIMLPLNNREGSFCILSVFFLYSFFILSVFFLYSFCILSVFFLYSNLIRTHSYDFISGTINMLFTKINNLFHKYIARPIVFYL